MYTVLIIIKTILYNNVICQLF